MSDCSALTVSPGFSQKQSLIGDQAALVRGQLLGPKVSRKAGAIDRAGSPLALWSGGTDEVRW